MTTPTVTELIRNGNHVGERVELGRYTAPAAGERIIYGQRVSGVVSFLPEDPVVLVVSLGLTDDDGGRSRDLIGVDERANAVRPKRSNGVRDSGGVTARQPEVGS